MLKSECSVVLGLLLKKRSTSLKMMKTTRKTRVPREEITATVKIKTSNVTEDLTAGTIIKIKTETKKKDNGDLMRVRIGSHLSPPHGQLEMNLDWLVRITPFPKNSTLILMKMTCSKTTVSVAAD